MSSDYQEAIFTTPNGYMSPQYPASKELGVSVKIVEPGFTSTDFGGQSFDLQTGEVADYQPSIDALMKGWRGGSLKRSPASLVADVIYQAATDESTKLRYRSRRRCQFLIR